MELIEWAQAFKSLALSQKVTALQNVSNIAYFAAYLSMIHIASTRQLRLSFLLLIACVFISNSLIYDLVNGWQLHAIYSIIYLSALPYINKLRVMLALFAIASFNILMAWDAANYAHTETMLYNNYEHVTAFLHGLVILTSANWRKAIARINMAINHIRISAYNSCFILHI
jgi:hypothetical protein